ncbi:TetR/AcrR family transcriptional regulator [Sphingopyxis sp. J-6]|uniref:TetR/AcrR family transcriptional regulator n=1 Tax=Sphingopyxis sp. J-6 TaxID=3122054 RepID=UPI0039843739
MAAKNGSDGQGTRDKLIDAAFRAVARDGLADTNVKSIAAEAGVNPGLLHYHFASKDALLEAAIESASGRYMAEIDALIAATPRARLFDAYVTFAAATLDANRDLFRVRLALGARAMNDARLAARLEIGNEAVRGRLATVFAAGAGRDTPSDLDRLRARATKAAFEGMMLSWLTNPDFPMRAVLGEWAEGMRAVLHKPG